MRWIALWTLTGLVVLAMPVTAEARGSLRWKQVATATAPLVGDGTTVAWEESPGRVLVNRAGAPARIVPAPADCAGHAVAVGAGRLLLACSDSPNGAHITGYTVVDIATGATRHVVVPAQAAGAGGEFPVFDQIGRDWLAGPYQGLHVSDTFLLDWRNGAQRVGARDPFGPKRYLDLSLPSLGRPLCSPLRRRPIPDDGTFTAEPKYYSLLVRGQWALEGGGTAKLSGNLRQPPLAAPGPGRTSDARGRLGVLDRPPDNPDRLARRGPRPPPPRPAHLQRGPAPAPRLLGRAYRDHPLRIRADRTRLPPKRVSHPESHPPAPAAVVAAARRPCPAAALHGNQHCGPAV
jgi:hypothetical protein